MDPAGPAGPAGPRRPEVGQAPGHPWPNGKEAPKESAGKLFQYLAKRMSMHVLSHMSILQNICVSLSKFKVFRMELAASVCQAARTGGAVLGAAVSASFRTPARPKGP